MEHDIVFLCGIGESYTIFDYLISYITTFTTEYVFMNINTNAPRNNCPEEVHNESRDMVISVQQYRYFEYQSPKVLLCGSLFQALPRTQVILHRAWVDFGYWVIWC